MHLPNKCNHCHVLTMSHCYDQADHHVYLHDHVNYIVSNTADRIRGGSRGHEGRHDGQLDHNQIIARGISFNIKICHTFKNKKSIA